MVTFNSIGANATGLVKYNGSGTFTAETTTNHAVLVGGASNAITSVGPSASTGCVLQSAGASADPAYSTATYPSTAGTSGNVLTSDGTNFTSVAPSAGVGSVTTQATTSGTDYTIAVSASSKIIIVTFAGVSSLGTDQLLLQLGDAGGIETSGYTGNTSNISTSTNWTTAIRCTQAFSAASHLSGTITLTLVNSATNTWGAVVNVSDNQGAANEFGFGYGEKALSAAITQLKVLFTGADTFDAGEFSVTWYT